MALSRNKIPPQAGTTLVRDTRLEDIISNRISTTSFNSRDAATLGSSAEFQGVAEEVSGYGRVGISIHSDNQTDGTLTIEVSHDGVIWSGPDRNIADARFANPVMWNIVEKWIKIKYVNGTTEADNLAIQVQYSNNADIFLGHPLDETLIDEMGAMLTRSIIGGKDDVTGAYQNVQTINHEGKTSLYTIAGFSNTESMHIDVSTSSTLIAYMLVDISDTTNWKHVNTGHLVIEYIIIQVNPATNFVGQIKLGYLKNVDATNGDFVQLIDIDMEQKSDILSEVIDFGSHGLHCDDAHHFGPTIANSTLFQTDVNLGGPDDYTTLTYPSGAGDLVMIVDGDGTRVVDVAVTIGYESVA